MDDNILLNMQKQLGSIESTLNSVKEDIVELKSKDLDQSQALEAAYNKAKARQDSIRDDLQHQIENNRLLITTVNDRFTDTIKSFGARIEEVENKKDKTIVNWWNKLVDRLIWAFMIAAGVVLLKWLNAPPELLQSFGQ
jgi:chromosome segregation ATPase